MTSAFVTDVDKFSGFVFIWVDSNLFTRSPAISPYLARPWRMDYHWLLWLGRHDLMLLAQQVRIKGTFGAETASIAAGLAQWKRSKQKTRHIC
ncbi:MAG: hypothetical protein ACJ74G_13575 [Blastocatellia bacterium]